jgi:hypothetical protein
VTVVEELDDPEFRVAANTLAPAATLPAITQTGHSLY